MGTNATIGATIQPDYGRQFQALDYELVSICNNILAASAFYYGVGTLMNSQINGHKAPNFASFPIYIYRGIEISTSGPSDKVLAEVGEHAWMF